LSISGLLVRRKYERRPAGGADLQRRSIMKVLCLLYADESRFPSPGGPEVQAAHGAFYEEVSGRGVFAGGDAVQPSSTATTVSVRDGGTDASAGPAKPGGEQIIGFYVLDVADQKEALELAARVPAARNGRVEVRPILVQAG
jgi:hypothetical protein